MEKLIIQILLCNSFTFLVLLSASCPSSVAGEVEDQEKFLYFEDSPGGPSRWGELRPEWSLCGNGQMQSPIDVSNGRVEVVSYSYLKKFLSDYYKPSNATLVNRGHDVMLKWEGGAGLMEINGTQYELKHCHWHSPSEHTINGIRYDLEVHLVHQSKSNDIAVIGTMYQIGRPDSFLSEISGHLAAMANTREEKRVVGRVDPNKIKTGSKKFYRYIGSLTTPPCTENVVWTIETVVRTVSSEQVQLLRDVVLDEYANNARPVQPINSRSVNLYQPALLHFPKNKQTVNFVP